MARRQGHFSLVPQLFEWIYGSYEKLGYKSASMLVEDMLLYGLEHKFKDKNPVSSIKAFKAIGESANLLRGRRFAISKAPDVLDDTLKGFDKAYKKGLITEQKLKALKEEAQEIVQRVVDLELSKRKAPPEEKPTLTKEEIAEKPTLTKEEIAEKVYKLVRKKYVHKCGSRDGCIWHTSTWNGCLSENCEPSRQAKKILRKVLGKEAYYKFRKESLRA